MSFFGSDWESTSGEREARLERALELIRSHSNGTLQDAFDMQMIAAEALFPGRFPTPERIKKLLGG